MTNQLTRGLEHINWLTQAQGARLLRCRRVGRGCAFRFQPKSDNRKIETDVPFLCGFIVAGTTCANRVTMGVQGRLL